MSDDKPMWGIHMPLSLGMSPVQDGFIAIGWPDVGDLSKITANRSSFKEAVAEAYPEKKPGAIPIDAGTLFKFAAEMRKNDLVVYPSKSDRMVNLGLVDGDYFYNKDQADFPNRRKIKWIQHIPRTEFSQTALHEIGSFVTLFAIKNNTEEFIAAFEGETLPTEDVDEDTEQAASASTEEATTDFVIKRLKTKLDTYQFEKFVAHLLERMGYHARVTQKSGDGGIDIIAHRDELGFEPPIIKVQCKQTLSTIGQPDVAQLYGHIQHGEHGLFVTLGEYSAQAKQFERGKSNLRLIDGEQLIALIFSHYDKFDPRYQMLLPMKKVYIPGVVSAESVFD